MWQLDRSCRHAPAVVALVTAALLLLLGCNQPSTTRSEAATATEQRAAQPGNSTPHDLSADEARGGHTLKRHVGRTDEELQSRLAHEHIAAASTYTGRATAEAVIGATLVRNRERIQRWLERKGGHPNLVLDYDSKGPVGRTLHRGQAVSQPCSHAIVVLKYDGPDQYHVLTSYPECR